MSPAGGWRRSASEAPGIGDASSSFGLSLDKPVPIGIAAENPSTVSRRADEAPGAPARFAADVQRLVPADGLLALAVSGGPDSMAMLVLAAEAFPGQIAAGTVDHGLRDDAADEAAMVARHCAALGVPHTTLYPAEPIAGASLQARARDARYALLTEWAHAADAQALLTAHHADDQAETFLMRAARGSGLAGLAGIRPRQRRDGVLLLRPLLGWRRAELRATVRRAGAPFVDDPSNVDDRHDRSRFRRLLDTNEWLDPPNLARAAAQLAEIDADLRDLMHWLIATRDRPAAAGEIKVEVADLPRELRRRLARQAIGRVRSAAAIATPAWDEGRGIEPLLDALDGGGSATQAGVRASARGTIWRFRAAPPRRSG